MRLPVSLGFLHNFQPACPQRILTPIVPIIVPYSPANGQTSVSQSSLPRRKGARGWVETGPSHSLDDTASLGPHTGRDAKQVFSKHWLNK